MKIQIVAILYALVLTACASTAKYSNGDNTSQGVKVALGTADGIKAGDKLKALQKDCSPDGRSKTCRYNTIGYLTVVQVDSDKSLLARPDSSISFDENTYFEKFRSCQEPHTKLDKGC